MVIMHIGGHTNMRMVGCRSGLCCAGRCAPDAAATPQALPPVTLSIPPALHCRCPTMTISTFDDLLQAARQPAQPQRLLLVIAGASLPAGATAEQRARFDAGESGALAPLMWVAKNPQALASFQALVDEAATLGPAWAVVFAGALSGAGGQPPGDRQIDAALQRLEASVKAGDLAGLIPFDRQGEAVQLL